MVVEKAWTLSDDNRQVIKKNAQKIKDFLTLKKLIIVQSFIIGANITTMIF